MTYATISADIVSSTSLSKSALIELAGKIKSFLELIAERYPGFWGRLVKGDSIECVMNDANQALRIAVMLKALVKSYQPSESSSSPQFKGIGLRMAIGIGEMRIVDRSLDIMDGEAIYLSGRALMDMREKNSFQLVTKNDVCNGAFKVIINLLNLPLSKATKRQCETLFFRLQSSMDEDVAERMNISRQGVNQNLRNIGWDAIKSAIDYFENINFAAI
jgi:hypothetical protein